LGQAPRKTGDWKVPGTGGLESPPYKQEAKRFADEDEDGWGLAAKKRLCKWLRISGR